MRSLIGSALLALVLAAPASAETRALSGFNSISAQEGIELDISQGPNFSVTVEGRDAPQIITAVSGHWLNISRRGIFNFGDVDARVSVTLPHLTALTASQGVAVSMTELESTSLRINLSQGAALSAPSLRVGSLTIAASQGAEADMGGACTNLEARAAMGGSLDASKLECASAHANASMGGIIEVHASGAIDARASMGGVIDVSGNPSRREANAGLGGTIDIN